MLRAYLRSFLARVKGSDVEPKTKLESAAGEANTCLPCYTISAAPIAHNGIPVKGAIFYCYYS